MTFSSEKPLLTIGVVSDTHVPDRVEDLHPELIPALERANVGHILHAGDVCSRRIIERLGQIAPVTAVRGNRDWTLLSLPMTARLELAGVPISLIHGHGGLAKYLVDKVRFIRQGYNLKRYLNLLDDSSSGAKVIVFGHTHFPEMVWRHNKLLFNPGSSGQGRGAAYPPSMGLLRIYPGGQLEPELVYLEGYRLRDHRWVAKK